MPENYYCLIAGLPDLLFDDSKQPFTVDEFKHELEGLLHEEDYQLMKLIFMKNDNYNLLNLLQKNEKEFINSGNYTQDELEEQIKEPENLPEYMLKFIEIYKSQTLENTNLTYENQLTELYYNYILTVDNEFLNYWFQTELNIRNIFTALNCRKYNITLVKEVIGDNTVAQAVRKSHAKDFGLGKDLPYVDQIIRLFENENLQEREKGIDSIKWNILSENTFFHYFTIEKVIGYITQLLILERWVLLDNKKGREKFTKILDNLHDGYTLSDEFSLK